MENKTFDTLVSWSFSEEEADYSTSDIRDSCRFLPQ